MADGPHSPVVYPLRASRYPGTRHVGIMRSGFQWSAKAPTLMVYLYSPILPRRDA